MRRNSRSISLVVGFALVGVLFLYTGYVKSYLDDEVQTTYFIKKYPAFKMEFFDPFANEGDDVPIEKLSLSERSEFADYCRFRFGISGDDNRSLERCKAGMPNYLK
ncbi:MAG: hypothetical protein V4801_27810 [Burkholderia gladioli]